MNDAHPDLARQLAPRRPRPSLALLPFLATVAALAAIGAWHVLRWLTLAAVDIARSWGL